MAEVPSWLNLVCRSAGVVNRFDGLAEVVGEGVGGGDDVGCLPGSGWCGSGGRS